jgi:hypothetical protein
VPSGLVILPPHPGASLNANLWNSIPSSLVPLSQAIQFSKVGSNPVNVQESTLPLTKKFVVSVKVISLIPPTKPLLSG